MDTTVEQGARYTIVRVRSEPSASGYVYLYPARHVVQHEDILSVLARLAAVLLSDAAGHVSIAMRKSLVFMGM